MSYNLLEGPPEQSKELWARKLLLQVFKRIVSNNYGRQDAEAAAMVNSLRSDISLPYQRAIERRNIIRNIISRMRRYKQ